MNQKLKLGEKRKNRVKMKKFWYKWKDLKI